MAGVSEGRTRGQREMIDIKAIKAAAEAVRNDVFHVRHDFGKHYVLVGPGEYFMGRVRGKERADFIATANPTAVYAMCDEIERLTACLKKANDQAEHFEREWYLRGDEIERLRADAARYKKLVAMEADLVEPITIWHYLRNPDDLDAAMEAK